MEQCEKVIGVVCRTPKEGDDRYLVLAARGHVIDYWLSCKKTGSQYEPIDIVTTSGDVSKLWKVDQVSTSVVEQLLTEVEKVISLPSTIASLRKLLANVLAE